MLAIFFLYLRHFSLFFFDFLIGFSRLSSHVKISRGCGLTFRIQISRIEVMPFNGQLKPGHKHIPITFENYNLN